MKKNIKMIIVDDSEVVRLGLKSLLSMYPHLEIVGEAANADQAICLTKEKRPDVILMDIRMPQKSGISACKEILSLYPHTSIIMLTSYDDDEAIYESIMAGASGYILKEISSDDIIHSIEEVAKGRSLLDPAITAKVFKRMRMTEIEKKIQELTAQEKQVLSYISQGLTNKEIAKVMVLSEKTIRNYISQIFSKLEVHNRAEAAVFAVRNHLDD